MPGLAPGPEWAAFYDEFAAAFDLTIDRLDPAQGADPLLETVADSPGIATIVGEETTFVWPPDYGLRTSRDGTGSRGWWGSGPASVIRRCWSWSRAVEGRWPAAEWGIA
jgi:hypothetical protein